MKHKDNLAGPRRWASVFVSTWVAAVACVTGSQPPVQPPTSARPSTSVQDGPAVHHLAPLPDAYPMRVTVRRGDGSPTTEHGLTGWDFNGDGRVDYLVVPAAVGGPIRVFDFDFDGEPDRVVKVGQPEAPSAPTPAGSGGS